MPRLKASDGAAAARPNATPAAIYQLKISLRNIRPPIWRRATVPGDFTFSKLHEVIQDVFGWGNYHLYEFSVGGVRLGEPDPTGMLETKNANRYKLNQMGLGERAKFLYTYDYGDDWQHEILVEKVTPPEPGIRYPCCIGGKRACPPDDCGGPWGYPELLAALADPAHPEHDEMLEWVGGAFDPDAFDVVASDAALAPLRAGR